MLTHMHVVAQQFVRAQHQFAKVHHAFALALLFVQLVQLHLAAGLVIAHRHIARALAVLLAARNEILKLLRRKAVFVHIELLAQALDGRQLVLRVQNLKGLRQARQLVVRPQKAVAQAVEGANPHGVHVHRQHGLQAQLHFFGRFVGEGHRQNAAGGDLRGLQEPGDARGQHPGFARTCARQNQRVLGWQGHGSVLLIVELAQQGNGGGLARQGVRGEIRQHLPIVETSTRSSA